MRLDVSKSVVTVGRSGAKHGELVLDGASAGLPLDIPEATSNEEWKSILGDRWFQLTDDEGRGGPSFRSLFSYFVRRQEAGGFDDPFEHMRQQQRSDQQVNLSYLLGLDWKIPQEWQKVRDQERSLRELRKAVSEGVFGETI